MQIQTDNGALVSLDPNQAEELFNLLHDSRGFLHPWLPWLSGIHSPLDMESFIRKRLQEQALHLCIRLSDGTLCGGVGFYQIDHAEKSAVLGYWLGESFLKQGVMLDALHHACAYGFAEMALHTLIIRCPVNNPQGRNAAERMGFRLDEIVPKAAWLGDDYVDHACYSLSKQAFFSGRMTDSGRTVAGM